jgi:predicted SAM-dependent methyltransferase
MVKRPLGFYVSLFFQHAFTSIIRLPAISKYLNTHKTRKLHIGSGWHIIDSWLNTDIYGRVARGKYAIPLDARKRFPFRQNSFSYVFSEHLIEHLTYPKALQMLRECFRVLKPGGKIRIATPDLGFLHSIYHKKRTQLQEKYAAYQVEQWLQGVNCSKDAFLINSVFRNWEHKFIFDFESLKYALEKAGFTDVHRQKLDKSDDINLQNLESHGKFIKNHQRFNISGDELNQLETLVVEARKP